jgi:hypothetical protein
MNFTYAPGLSQMQSKTTFNIYFSFPFAEKRADNCQAKRSGKSEQQVLDNNNKKIIIVTILRGGLSTEYKIQISSHYCGLCV